MKAPGLIATARKYLSVREVQPNSGPWIDDALAFVGCKPGDSWCAAAVCKWIHETEPTFSFHKSASALALLRLNSALVVTDPEPGDIVVWDHGHGLGHVAIVTIVVRVDGVVASLTAIAGNTSADGHSRNGDRVAEHEVSLDRVAGYIRVCSSD